MDFYIHHIGIELITSKYTWDIFRKIDMTRKQEIYKTFPRKQQEKQEMYYDSVLGLVLLKKHLPVYTLANIWALWYFSVMSYTSIFSVWQSFELH